MFRTATNPLLTNLPLQRRDVFFDLKLNGKIDLNVLMDVIYREFHIHYKVLSAEIEYIGQRNFGRLQLLLTLDNTQQIYLEQYFAEHEILNYAADFQPRKKAV